MSRPAEEGPVRARPLLLLLLAVAAAQYLWNAAAQPAFWGYDEGAHAAFALAIREQGGLPHPLSGWSSFHPPLYHVLGAGAWALLEPLGGGAVLFGLRAIAAAGALVIGLVVHRLSLAATGDEAIALVACALALFVPAVQLSGAMAGNEALAAGFAAAVMLPLRRLQRDPGDPRAAALAGLFAGLAFATKYTGGWAVAICGVPFLRGGLGRREWRAAAVCAGVVLAVAAPVYVRNAVLTGTPLPFTRTLQPMKRFEEKLLVRPRRLADYVTWPWRCGQYPYVTVVAERGLLVGANPAMQSVPCLTYVGLWFDPFGIRAARRGPSDGVVWGNALVALGLAPTLVLLVGLGRAARRVFATRGRAVEAPPLVHVALGLGSYAAFTWLAPSLAAAKASYLLPLAAPAGLFFAQGCAALPRGARRAVLAVSLAAAALAALVFTTGLVFGAADAPASRAYWTAIGRELPESRIAEAASRLIE